MLRAIGPVTKVIAGLNIAAYLLGLLWDVFTGSAGQWHVEGGFWSIRVSQALFETETTGIPSDYPWLIPVWLTPITSAFLHGGIFHLLMNMLVLLAISTKLEDALGSLRYAMLYGIGMIAAAAAHFVAEPLATVPVVGASGAISALLAAYFVLFPRRIPAPVGPISGRIVQIVWLAAAWIGINLLTGFAFSTSDFGVAIYAHIGGFMAGLLLALPFDQRRKGPPFHLV